jgi:hypothetical protein
MPTTRFASRPKTLMSWHDCNLAGDAWTWRIFIRRRADGSVSVGARQRGNIEGGGFRIRGSYRLRDGERILMAIEDLFMNDMLQGMEPGWGEILTNAKVFDPRLGTALEEALEARAEEIAAEAIEDAMYY